jgi:hypothetical protein
VTVLSRPSQRIERIVIPWGKRWSRSAPLVARRQRTPNIPARFGNLQLDRQKTQLGCQLTAQLYQFAKPSPLITVISGRDFGKFAPQNRVDVAQIHDHRTHSSQQRVHLTREKLQTKSIHERTPFYARTLSQIRRRLHRFL